MDESAQETRSSTSISVQGDRTYVQQLKALAALKGISLSRLTREALDSVYGHELKSPFFADPVAFKQQTSNESGSKK